MSTSCAPLTTAGDRRALVLAGGGALGAYEAGVLRFVLGEVAPSDGPGFDIFTGTSVGALNSCFLAAHADEAGRGARELEAYWRTITPERVLGFGIAELRATVGLLAGREVSLGTSARPPRGAPHQPVAGFFDTAALQRDIQTRIPWGRLQRHLTSGSLHGVALCATEICTGKSIIFYQAAPGAAFRVGKDPSKEARPVRLRADHALASAAMPFIFPSVQVDGICYCDGGLRQNTPLNPALRFGADRVLVISVTQSPELASRVARAGCRRNPYPGAFFLLGRTLQAILAQTLDYELGRVEMYNQLMVGGCEVYGDRFVENLNRIMGTYRNATYRPVQTCHIRPSQDLNALAREALRDAPDELRLPGLAGRMATKFLRSPAFLESELLSVLLFTPTYIRRLLDLGYRDAQSHADAVSSLWARSEAGS